MRFVHYATKYKDYKAIIRRVKNDTILPLSYAASPNRQITK